MYNLQWILQKKYGCDFLIVDVGMGSANFNNFGNLYCEEYEIDCGMGSIILNISNILKMDKEINISIGMGSIEINIIEGNNVIVEINQSLLSNLEFEQMNLIKTNVYRNESYEKSKPSLKINVSIGLGELSINWIK